MANQAPIIMLTSAWKLTRLGDYVNLRDVQDLLETKYPTRTDKKGRRLQYYEITVSSLVPGKLESWYLYHSSHLLQNDEGPDRLKIMAPEKLTFVGISPA